MSIKKKLGMGVATAVLGLGLIGGGTFAYFNDIETSENTFAAGTLDLSVSPTTVISVDNLKPGDTMLRHFKLINDGSLDIANVLLNSEYTVNNAKDKDENVEDFGEHIQVNFLRNEDKEDNTKENVIMTTTLAELHEMELDLVETTILDGFGEGKEDSGLGSKSDDDLYVEFEFVDNEEDQNEFQGDSIDLTWTFEATQEAGEER